MIIFATNRNINGYRKYLIIDSINHLFATDKKSLVISKEDMIIIKAADYKKLLNEFSANENYKQVERL